MYNEHKIHNTYHPLLHEPYESSRIAYFDDYSHHQPLLIERHVFIIHLAPQCIEACCPGYKSKLYW